MAEATTGVSETHVCRECKQEFPATTEFFYKAGRYFNWQCKPCMIRYAGEWKRRRHGRTGPYPKVCAVCGKSWLSIHRDAKCCSKACQVEATHARDKARRLKQKQALSRTCVRCGSPIPARCRVEAKFCSARCNEQAHKQTRKFRRRVGETRQRRTDEPLISLVEIAARSGWRCGLCGKPVDRTLRHPDPFAPSLDHVVPVSLGGTNDPANLQLAHLRCNLSKRDSARGEQLRLVA